MTLSSAQQKRLTQIGGFLIEEGFSSLLVDTGLLPEIGFFDRVRETVLASGSNDERLINLLEKIGSTGQAFAFFAAHRPDLFETNIRNACVKFCDKTRNQVSSFDSETAKKMLKRLAGKTQFDILPFLVTPFASYYRSSSDAKNSKQNFVAKLFHSKIISEVHHDLSVLHEILQNQSLEQSRLLLILSEFAEFIVDYFTGDSLRVTKKTKEGLLVSVSDGILLSDVKKVLKHDESAKVADEIMQKWLVSVFVEKKLLYDVYFWQWSTESKTISFVDAQPIAVLNDKERRTLLTFFTALHHGDEKTAAACVISMCDATDASLDLAERLVSANRARLVHPFVAGTAILEEALTEGMQIKPTFAKITASASQISLLVKQYTPTSHHAFDQINHLLAEHDINLQRLHILQSQNSEAEIMKNSGSSNSSNNSNSISQMHVGASDEAINRLAKEIDKSSNRIAYSAIIAAFTIAGALLVVNAGQIGVLLLGVPFFVVAFFTALLLITSIIREPK